MGGTAASCYAIPENLSRSSIYRGLSQVASAASLQSTYHALFSPLRVACRAAATIPQLGPWPATVLEAALASKDSLKNLVAQPKNAGPIHPYAWALYIGFSSLVA